MCPLFTSLQTLTSNPGRINMRWGSPWSAGWGSPDNHFTYTIPDAAAMAAGGNTYLPLRFKLRPGLDGAYVGIYRNAQFIRNVFDPVETEYNTIVDIPWGLHCYHY